MQPGKKSRDSPNGLFTTSDRACATVRAFWKAKHPKEAKNLPTSPPAPVLGKEPTPKPAPTACGTEKRARGLRRGECSHLPEGYLMWGTLLL